MDCDWQVTLDHEGRVVVGRIQDGIEGRYLVVPQPDGSLELRALERTRAPTQPEPPSPAPVMGTLDEDAAEAELARWGMRALGDLSPGQRPAPGAPSSAPLPLIEVPSGDRPQPAAIPSSDAEANSPILSAVDAAYRYWLIQNRDAHDLFRVRGASGRASAAGPSKDSRSPA